MTLKYKNIFLYFLYLIFFQKNIFTQFVPGFGVNGSIIRTADTLIFNSFAIANQNKIVAVGNTLDGVNAIITRYNSDGSVDTTFNNTGYKIETAANTGTFKDCIVDNQERIIVIGRNDFARGLITRYTKEGALDTTFGTSSGRSILSATGEFNSCTLTNDGKIIAVSGDTGVPSLIVRYTSEGRADTTFAPSGYINAGTIGVQALRMCQIDKDESIVAVGRTAVNEESGQTEGIIVCYTPAGALDERFNNVGYLIIPEATELNGFAFDDEGKIIAVGKNPEQKGIVIRCDLNGLDTSFNSTGYSIIDRDYSVFNSCIVDSQVGIVAYGTVDINNTTIGLIGYYQLNGQLNSIISKTGYELIDTFYKITKISLDSQKRIIMCGAIPTPVRGIIERRLINGKPDSQENWNYQNLKESCVLLGRRTAIL